jgi:hypothetical protein
MSADGLILTERTTLNRQLLHESSEQMPVPRVVHYAIDEMLARLYLRALHDGREIERLWLQMEARPLGQEEPSASVDAYTVPKDRRE